MNQLIVNELINQELIVKKIIFGKRVLTMRSIQGDSVAAPRQPTKPKTRRRRPVAMMT